MNPNRTIWKINQCIQLASGANRWSGLLDVKKKNLIKRKKKITMLLKVLHSEMLYKLMPDPTHYTTLLHYTWDMSVLVSPHETRHFWHCTHQKRGLLDAKMIPNEKYQSVNTQKKAIRRPIKSLISEMLDKPMPDPTKYTWTWPKMRLKWEILIS